jgi:hypothetical protein
MTKRQQKGVKTEDTTKTKTTKTPPKKEPKVAKPKTPIKKPEKPAISVKTTKSPKEIKRR